MQLIWKCGLLSDVADQTASDVQHRQRFWQVDLSTDSSFDATTDVPEKLVLLGPLKATISA